MPTTPRKRKIVLEAIRDCEEVTEYRIIYLQNLENVYGKRVGDRIQPATVRTWIDNAKIHQTDPDIEIWTAKD